MNLLINSVKYLILNRILAELIHPLPGDQI
jgi:hypothetical protein